MLETKKNNFFKKSDLNYNKFDVIDENNKNLVNIIENNEISHINPEIEKKTINFKLKNELNDIKKEMNQNQKIKLSETNKLFNQKIKESEEENDFSLKIEENSKKFIKHNKFESKKKENNFDYQ